jgi:DNA polymerase III epsilon subunit-like protein
VRVSDRDVARIAVVDEDEKVVFDQYVKPTKPIVSYLTQLTGITERSVAGQKAEGFERGSYHADVVNPSW